MTPEAAIQSFLSSFDIPAYAAASTPAEAEFPYITYNLVIGDFISGDTPMQIDLWYYTDSEKEINAKAREIADKIGLGGVMLQHDNGSIWVKRGNPWCQSVVNESNEMVKRRYINIDLEYL